MHSLIKYSLPGTVKDVDKMKGEIQAYWSAFTNMDSDGDMISPGAYTDTIRENGPGSKLPRIKVLWQHDYFSPAIGIPERLSEDQHGLLAEYRITKGTERGRDTLILLDEGIITEHSVGIDVLERSDEDQRIITKAKLWEGSPVNWGANPLTPVLDVKHAQASRMAALDYLVAMASNMKSALKEPLTDETAFTLEGQLSVLMAQLQDLKRQIVPNTPGHPTEAEWVAFFDGYLSAL